MKYLVHRHRYRLLFFLVLVVLAIALVLGWRTFIGKGGEIAPVDDQASGQITGRPSPRIVSSRTLSFGGIYLGGAIDDQAKNSTKKFEFPFQPLGQFGRQEYDAWITGLECPLTDAVVPTAEQEKGVRNCPSNYGAEITKWFDILAIGDENSGDQGQEGFAKTKSVLDENRGQYIGNYNQDFFEDVCEIVNLPARYTLNDGSFKEADMPIVVCSVDVSQVILEDLIIDEINKYSKILPTWVYAHNINDAAVLDKQIYQSFIDAGASLVVASDSATAERIEAYKGKLIVYSLGNFIGSKPEGKISFGLGVEISAQLDQSVLLWTRLSPECSKFDDSCIETAKNQGLVLPRYSYKFSTVALIKGDDLSLSRSSQKDNEAFQTSIGWESVIANLTY